MKKSILFSLVLLSAATLNSCTEKIGESSLNERPEALRTIKVRASLDSDDASTKTLWKDGEGLQWTESDGSLLGLVDDKGTNKAVESFSINVDGTASFDGTVAADATHFFAYYPKVESAGGGAGDLTINFPISAQQRQSAAGSIDLSSGMMALVGKAPVELGDGVEYSAGMELQSSLARFIIYSGKGSSDKVKSVSLKSSGNVNISGLWVVIKTWNGEGRSFIAGDQKSKTTVSLETFYDLSGVTSQETALGIYMGLCPATLENGYVCEVVTDKGKYTFETVSSKVFEAGAIHNIALNLDKAQFESTASELLVLPNGSEPIAQGVPKEGNKLYLGPTVATYGGEPISMIPEDCILVSVNPDGTDASSWAAASWENTNNYNLQIIVAKNNSAAARECKVYLEYKGIRSKNYIIVRQDPGTGLPMITPSLVKLHESEIAYGGETVAEAAELRLAIDGVEVVGADVDSYLSDSKYGISLSCAETTLSCRNGVVSIVFPENAASVARNYRLSVKTEDGSAECTFTQAANPGGDMPSHVFEYNLITHATDGSKSTGFGPADGPVGDWYHFENIKIDGKSYEPADLKLFADSDVFQELLTDALVLVELENDDVQVPGADPLTSVEEMRQFVTFEAWNDGGAAIYVRIKLAKNDTGSRRTFKICAKAADGSVLTTVVYFQNA